MSFTIASDAADATSVPSITSPGSPPHVKSPVAEFAFAMHLPATVGSLQGDEFVSVHRPVYTDLDVNGHVNNARYADWLCNTLGIDLMTRSELETVILNYNREVLPDQQVTLHRILRENQYRLAGYVGDALAFDIGGILRPLA